MPDALDADWAGVGEALTKRLDALKWTKAELIRRSGISDKTIDRYLAGKRIVRRDKERALCEAVGWTSDSVQRILDGKDPMEATAAALRPPEFEARDRYEAIERRLDHIERLLEEIRAEQSGVLVRLSERPARVEVTPELLDALAQARGETPTDHRRNEPA